MPTYHYRCKACLYEFEEFQKMSDPPLVMCPECNKNTLARIIAGGAGLVFKGTGFYITDYRNGKKTDTAAVEEKPAAKTDKKQAGKKADSDKKEQSG